MIPRFFLLAAGIGSRLRPLTDTRPKALVEIGSMPLSDRWFHRIEPLQTGPAEARIPPPPPPPPRGGIVARHRTDEDLELVRAKVETGATIP